MSKKTARKPKHTVVAPPLPLCLQFVVFVDGMDGDVYADWASATSAVTHAFMNGASKVTLKKWNPNKKVLR